MPTSGELAKIKRHVKDDSGRLPAIFDAIGDSNRCKIFRMLLTDSGLCVSDIAEVLEVSIPAASQHLKIMEQAKVLTKEKKGQSIYYHINKGDPVVRAISDIIKE